MTVTDTWESRDLPVLRAIAQWHDEHVGVCTAERIESATGFNAETVQRALRALRRGEYFEKVQANSGGVVRWVGPPTALALRAAGQWPSPEAQWERVIAALTAAAEDESCPEEERSKARKALTLLGGTLSQIAIGALSGAGGNIITG